MGRAGNGGSHSNWSYSTNASDYKLVEEIGRGASATVFKAIFLPFNKVVAVKCLDLDRCNSNLDDIRREAQTMSLIDHPNAIRAYCSFVVERNLWVVMPFMAEGSCQHLMKTAYPDGLEEPAICSILKETLKALEYLHRHGHIHRDVKAGNILLDTNGLVKLGDFGVSACMFDNGDRKRSRSTFVGTPCWMAPEVLQPGSEYDFKADIWSFGITALELAHGHAPFSKHPPVKIFLMTVYNAPPGLDYDRDKKFSKSFREMVTMCLVKDPAKRPTAENLLKHSFFKRAKPPELSVKKLFADLPPLLDREKALQLKDAAKLALKRMPSTEQEAISQSEYKRGVSAWNFDIEDLKAQASMVQGDDDLAEIKEGDESVRSASSSKNASYAGSTSGTLSSLNDIICREQVYTGEIFPAATYSLDNEPRKNVLKKGGLGREFVEPLSTKDAGQPKAESQTFKGRQSQSGPLMPEVVFGQTSERGCVCERPGSENQPLLQKSYCNAHKVPSFSGPLMLPTRASANSMSAPIKPSGGYRDSLDDKSKANLVQIKGRFSITSENLEAKDIPSCSRRRSLQGSPLRKSASVDDWISESMQMASNQPNKDVCNANVSASLLLPHLQHIFQQTAVQQDLIMNLLNNLRPAEVVDVVCQNGKLSTGLLSPCPRNVCVETEASERERLLLIKITELQARMLNLTEELHAEKQKCVLLRKQVNAVSSQEDEDRTEVVA